MRDTVLSTEEGMKVAATASDVANEISAITAQQRASTEQVTRAIEDISTVATQVSTGSSQTLAAARDLNGLSEHLGVLVSTFQLPTAS
jgi:methyl-accepting chemotaxis protein